MAFKLPNLTKKLSNAKTRTLVILLGGIILLGIIIAVVRGTGGAQADLAKDGSQAVGIPSELRSTPGSVVSEQYRELQVKDNERRAQEALKSKTSAIPTIIGGVHESAASKNLIGGPGMEGNLQFGSAEGKAGAFGPGGPNPFGPGGPGGGPGGLGGTGPGGVGTGLGGAAGMQSGGLLSGQAALERQRSEQEARLKEQRENLDKMRLAKERQTDAEKQRQGAEKSKKEYQAAVQQLAGQMKSYANGAYSEWSKVNPQQYVQGTLVLQKEAVLVTNPVVGGVVSPMKVRERIAKSRPSVYIKAGTVLFGVMDTAVNSDVPGPVLATIVSGKLQGSRMIGSFQHEAQQTGVVIQFNQLSIPKRARSLSIQAVAIDPDTARTAVATNVDRHILLRYGSIFASSFISGYGKAITQQGTTTVSPLTGTTTTQTPTLDNKQIFFAALGELGTQWGQAIKPYFNTPYTVTVDQGTGVGILFLTDVDVTEEATNG